MEKLVKIFEVNKGYARMLDLKKAGIHTRTIAKAVADKTIEKVKPGLYKLTDFEWDENESFTDVCAANKKAVICLLSAASYWDMTTFNPNQIDTAVPHNTDKFTLQYPPIKVYYFSDKHYLHGIEFVKTGSGEFRIYSKEKTIADLFRYINKIGEDVVIESLKTYVQNKMTRNIPELIEYARKAGVAKKLEPILKGLL